jgi:hypothetical protein
MYRHILAEICQDANLTNSNIQACQRHALSSQPTLWRPNGAPKWPARYDRRENLQHASRDAPRFLEQCMQTMKRRNTGCRTTGNVWQMVQIGKVQNTNKDWQRGLYVAKIFTFFATLKFAWQNLREPISQTLHAPSLEIRRATSHQQVAKHYRWCGI